METKANHLAVGSFVLVLLIGGFAFLMWLARVEISREFSYYTMYFTDSVFGLGQGGDVRFNGVRIGRVTAIEIDREDPARVRVLVEVDGETPIRTDSVASLQLQGITGVSFVQISGGSPNSPFLEQRRGEPPPEIATQPSHITQLVESAPELLARGIAVLERMEQVLSPENSQHIAAMIADAAAVTATVAAQTGRIESILVNADATAEDVAQAARAMRSLAERIEGLAGGIERTIEAARGTLSSVDEVVAGELRQLLTEAARAAQSFAGTADQVQAMMRENREPLSDFAVDGLSQFTRFITEARQLVSSMSRVTERIEADPARFLFGDRAPERSIR